MPDVRRILSPIHALDQSVNSVFTIFQTIFRWKTKVYESLGCALEMCSADVVVTPLQWFSFSLHAFTDIMIQTNVFTASSGGIAEKN